MMIDLRSDTVTLPSDGMREAIANAKVGDDVFMDDPSVNELQEYAAGFFGKEAALYVPSGTMANQISIGISTNPGEEVIAPEPFYANYNGFATTAGVVVVPVTSYIEDEFALPPIEESPRDKSGVGEDGIGKAIRRHFSQSSEEDAEDYHGHDGLQNGPRRT